MTADRPRIAFNPAVFLSSAAVIAAVLGFSLVFTDEARRWFPAAQDLISTYFGWFYILAVSFFLVFSLWLGLGRYGSIRLGADDERPEFGTASWFAMLFSAGMGIGLLFYGVAEPIFHYVDPPYGDAQTLQTTRLAMRITFFHWGLHAWGIYVVMGVAIAYFSFRRGLPLAIRSTLHPLLGSHVHGWPGHLVDIVAVFGTVFGLATSLGLGAMQINSGLTHLFGVASSSTNQVILIALITGCATVSLVSGLDRGIRRLSELNMVLAGLLLLFVFVAGPTLFLLDVLPDYFGNYVQQLVATSLWTDALRDTDWQRSWTIFYWAWWISWAPFVGMFVARVSRGRTIREFVLGVLLAPTALTVLWFTVMGGTALHLEAFGGGEIAVAVQRDLSVAIYEMLELLPFGHLAAVLAIVVVWVFFVTSSDSGSFVVDMLTSGGHPDPPVWQRVFWAVTEGAVAAVLLTVGGLEALQSAAINTGLPFCVVLVLVCFSLVRALREEELPR